MTAPNEARITPYICVSPALDAIAFYKQAFGATQEELYMDDQNRVSHAEIRVQGARIFLADEHPEINVLSPHSIGGSPITIVIQVPSDLDAFYQQALAAGATIERPMSTDDRPNAKIIDPFGHHWYLADL